MTNAKTQLCKPRSDGVIEMAKRTFQYEIRARHKHRDIEYILGWGQRNNAFLKGAWATFGFDWFDHSLFERVVIDRREKTNGNS